MRLSIVLASVLALLFVGACNSPHNASRETFKSVFLSRQELLKACIDVPAEYGNTLKFPVQIPKRNEREVLVHNLLVNAGLETKTERLEKSHLVSTDGKVQNELFLEYNPTSKGLEHLYVKKSIIKTNLVYCFGEVSNLEIENFTAPAAIMDKTVSKVNFSYDIKDIPDWLRNNVSILNRVLSPLKFEAIKEAKTLIYTDHGWVEQDSLSRIPSSLTKVN